jgi:hypothetical protein
MQRRTINEILPLSQIIYVIGKNILYESLPCLIEQRIKNFQLNRAVESHHLSNNLSLNVTLVYFDFVDNL